MHLILYHVTKLQEVSDTNSCWLIELLTSLTIIDICRAKIR